MLYETKLTNSVRDFLLQDEINNLNIFGILENVDDTKIYVDNIENPSGVIVVEDYFNYIYTENDEFIELVIDEFFSKSGEYGFSAVKSEIANKIKNRFELQWENPCTLYYYPNKNIDLKNINSEIRNLKIEEANIVDDYYTFKDEDSIFEIKESIKNRPSVCAIKNGELASWLLIHDDNSFGPMYTKEEYRKEGLAVDLTLALVDKQLKNHKIPFLHIINENDASHKLAKKCGFERYGYCDWFGIVVK